MPAAELQQGRVHHGDLGIDQRKANRDSEGPNKYNCNHNYSYNYTCNSSSSSSSSSRDYENKISYSAIVNKSISMNKPGWARASSLISAAASKTQQNQYQYHQHTSGAMEDRPFYRMTSIQALQKVNNKQQAPRFLRQHSRGSSSHDAGAAFTSRAQPASSSKNSYKLMTPSLIAMILATSLVITVPSARAFMADESPSSSSLSSSSGANSRPEQEPLAVGRDSKESTSGSSDKTSIVASLSSAVASAAAAAAVAGAKNSLSTGDARSLLSSSAAAAAASGHQPSGHLQRSPGLNFALKLADAIPEVPYSILHNMRKLDHAAPFYNVPGRLPTGSGHRGKESAQSLLVSALTSPGGAADQLSALFRSPLWKRIADGYGEFTSEFRSLFRARPTTMKGPSGSMTKLLRDISVPAALVLLASSAMPADWRPSVKSRRKSSPLEPALPELSRLAGVEQPMEASASESIRNYSPVPQQQQILKQEPPFGYLANAGQQQQQQVTRASGDMNLVAATFQQPQQIAGSSESVGGDTGNWMSPTATAKLASLSTWLGQQQQQQHLAGQLEQQMPIKRVGEQAMLQLEPANDATIGNSKYQQMDLKPVDHRLATAKVSLTNAQSPMAAEARELPLGNGGLFSSLTSNLAKINNPARLLMNKIMNANSHGTATATATGGAENQNYQIMAIAPVNGGNEQVRGLFSSLISRRDHQLLGDKHRYSLVGEEAENGATWPGSLSLSLSNPSSALRASLLSSARAAAKRILYSPSESGSSGSSRAKQPAWPQLDTNRREAAGTYLAASPPMELSADRTIKPRDPAAGMKLLRRDSSATSSGQAEQRDLSQLLPQSWREAVKRTVNSVKQEASTQWRSIEGQLTNWVQDKLKTLPMTQSQPASATGSTAAAASPATSPIGAAQPATGATGAPAPPAAAGQPVANLIASVSSTAMNMLGLGGRNSVVPAKGANPESAAESAQTSNSKNESTSGKTTSLGSIKSSALAGVASMIVNTLTNRQPTTTSSQKAATSSVESSESAAAQHSTLAATAAQASQRSTTPAAPGAAR